MSKTSIGFYGGADEVTGANFVLRTGGRSFAIDCGLSHGHTYDDGKKFDVAHGGVAVEGEVEDTAQNEIIARFGYEPSSLDVLFVTHAHADHIGRIPRLVRDGFAGTIWSTQATKDLTRVMLADAHSIIVAEARENGVPPLYDLADVAQTLRQWKTREYHEQWDVGDGVRVRFLDAGHILGSVMVEFTRAERKIIFTGDLGNTPAPLLPNTEKIHGAHYLVMESVYGDRNHENRDERIHELARAIRSVADNHGTLLIPTFALQRTQILIHEIHRLFKSGTVPTMPVFLDSPLASQVTDIFYKHRQLFNAQMQEEMRDGARVFDYPHFVEVDNARESYGIAHKDGPKIILASSGMSVGGRVRSHEKALLGERNTLFLFVGYQAYGTLGRRIQDGAKKLEIDGKSVRVRAEVRTIRGFSGHKDRDNLVRFVADSASTLEKVFVTLGEPKSAQSLADKIHTDLHVATTTQDRGDVVSILF